MFSGNRTVTLQFSLSRPDYITMSLYDLQGRQVLARAPEWFGEAGRHAIHWDLGALASSMYVVRVVTGSGLESAAKLSVFR
jgi:hypothetical protein